MNYSFKEIMHSDYLDVCKMRSSISVKVRLLTEITSQNPNTWRVVGVTKAALRVFEKNDFQRKSGMGINRSHLVDRNTTYRKLLKDPKRDLNDWWTFYYENDKCVFATKSENMSGGVGDDYIPIDESLGLFRSKGYAWTHRKGVEDEFLRALAS
jgi:hypothetical protein